MYNNEDDIITIKRSNMRYLMSEFAYEIMQELGIKAKPVNPEWVSKNQAVKINPKAFGRVRLERAINEGLVRKKSGISINRKYSNSPILVNRRDVENYIKNN